MQLVNIHVPRHAVTKMYDYVFSENGLVAFKDGKEFSRMVCIFPPLPSPYTSPSSPAPTLLPPPQPLHFSLSTSLPSTSCICSSHLSHCYHHTSPHPSITSPSHSPSTPPSHHHTFLTPSSHLLHTSSPPLHHTSTTPPPHPSITPSSHLLPTLSSHLPHISPPPAHLLPTPHYNLSPSRASRGFWVRITSRSWSTSVYTTWLISTYQRRGGAGEEVRTWPT